MGHRSLLRSDVSTELSTALATRPQISPSRERSEAASSDVIAARS
jgi:hypothetical protein